MLRPLKRTGFASIVEVIVTAVIFVLAAAGILTTISMLRPHGMESYRRVEAAYYAKNMMDTLRAEVEADTWANNTGDLSTGIVHSQTIGDYSINWYLNEVDPGNYPAGLAPRQLFMNVYYPD